MKSFLRILISLIISCSTLLQVNASDAGVPLEMARVRKAEITNLEYSIHYNIPSDTSKNIHGDINILFDFKKGRGERFLPIDFSPSADNIHEVKVNGKRCAPDIKEGHIYIDASMLRSKGNDIAVTFIPDDRHLNRRPDYMYTLFVPAHAHSAFPCFDQPDLKATFQLTLTIPDSWKCVGNSPVISVQSLGDGTRLVKFAQTEPLSTYLFAFTAGDFKTMTKTADGREITAYYRETDPKKIAQLDGIVDEIAGALRWQENFTGVKYPFAKYDFVALPGFQFGGMEHTGATFYNDSRLFLGESPTPEEVLICSQNIAHETSHMWFGDYVTMAWFDDVWTKEVFANYFAAAITRERLPEYDHDIEWLRTYVVRALSEDRSAGRTAIQQELGNLGDAGLIYNNIIYNKAPVMMAKLVEFIGEDAFRKGIRRYLERYGYGNATWDQLIECFQEFTSEPVAEFSRVWVKEKGMPEIRSEIKGNKLIVTQSDTLGNGNRWPQRFSIDVIAGEKRCSLPVIMTGASDDVAFDLPVDIVEAVKAGNSPLIIPNSDAKGYGLFTLEPEMLIRLLERVSASDSLSLTPSGVLAAWINLNENWLAKRIPDDKWQTALTKALAATTEPLQASALAGYMGALLPELGGRDREVLEKDIMGMVRNHPLQATRVTLLRNLESEASAQVVCDTLYSIWKRRSMPQLNENDYMNLAYEMAVRHPEEADAIISEQRSRISNPDRLAQFDFVSRAVDPDKNKRDEFFRYLLTPKGREIEPRAAQALYYLNHPLRRKEAKGYIYPALDKLQEVQRTGDIFFPGNWCKSLLGNHRSPEARKELDRFLAANPALKPLLLNKILNGAYSLIRATGGKNFVSFR